jgi:protein-disulfide isomerase
LEGGSGLISRQKSLVLIITLFLSLTTAFGAEPAAAPLAPELRVRIIKTLRIFYRVPPTYDVTVTAAGVSEYPGWQKLSVAFSAGDHKQTNDFLLSDDGKRLLRYVPLDVVANPGPQIDITGRPVRGSKDAKVSVVVFDDFQCPFCSMMHAQLFPEVLKIYGDKVRFIYKDYPLAEKHHWATRAAVDANCLAAQSNDAYWEYADQVHARQDEITGPRGAKNEAATERLDKMAQETSTKYFLDGEKLQACMKANDEKAITASVKEGDDLGVEATPTLYLDGEKLEGAAPVPQLEAILDRMLRDAGVEPPAHPAPEKKEATATSAPKPEETKPAATIAAKPAATQPAATAPRPITKK